ncbi:MAG: carbamoyltransferase HypF, partial [Phycisphaerae bacterium]|nr:carbamoyltransferase HypF [Phycisphaerae bacterium]
AVGIVQAAFGADWPGDVAAMFARVNAEAVTLLRQRLASDSARVVQTSSMGRLFDAVAFLLGLCDRNHTEAAAPIAVQALADSIGPTDPLAWDIAKTDVGLLLDTRPTIRAIIDGVVAGEPRATLARGFHEALGAMLTDAARRVCGEAGVGQVVLSGGCFLNGLLRDILRVGLDRAGLSRYTHNDLSPGDACVSLGQAVIAAQTLRAGAH